MAFDVDSSLEYQVWNNTHSIEVTSVQNAGVAGSIGNFTYTVPIVTRRAPTFREIASSGGKYTNRDVVWILPNKLVKDAGGLGDRQPKVADLVIGDDSITYTVLSADLQVEYTQWRLMSRDIILAFNLYDTITLQRFTIDTDAAGSKVYTDLPNIIASNVQAAIKETGGTAVPERGKKLQKREFSIWTAVPLQVQALDQVVDQNGVVYEVIGSAHRNDIDQLFEIRAEVRGWSGI